LSAPPARGVALECDESGVILEVVVDGIGLGEAQVGRVFAAIVDPSSFEKAMNFLSAVNGSGAAFDWELHMRAGFEPLHFAGVKTQRGVFIVAAPSSEEVQTLYDDLGRINNEQANRLRAAEKEQQLLRREMHETSTLYDELTRLNNELSNTQRELARSNIHLQLLNDQKNELLGMAAHDLRNPLAASLGFLAFIQEDSDNLTEDQQELLGRVHKIAQFQLRLVDDLLDVSKIEAGRLNLERTDFDLLELLADALPAHRVLADRKQIQIVGPEGAAAVEVRADRQKIEQVLQNLLSNAIKFSPKGSTVEVGVAMKEGEVVVSVSDRGPGIPEGEREKLFRPFSKLSVTPSGGEKQTGLGLSIARKIVEGHGGTIEALPREGGGTTFRFVLPV